MLRRVDIVLTDVSEERIASIFRVKIREPGTSVRCVRAHLAVSPCGSLSTVEKPGLILKKLGAYVTPL
jgi:hypothetical protein